MKTTVFVLVFSLILFLSGCVTTNSTKTEIIPNNKEENSVKENNSSGSEKNIQPEKYSLEKKIISQVFLLAILMQHMIKAQKKLLIKWNTK